MSRTLLVAHNGGFDPRRVPGLVIDLDPRDLSAGAITSWIDRRYGYDFAGTATRDATVNGKPTVSFVTSNNLISTANVTQLAGAKVITIIAALIDTTGASDATICTNYNASTNTDGWFHFYRSTSDHLNQSAGGNVGATQNYNIDSLSTARVSTTQCDFNAGTGQCSDMRIDGASVTSFANSNSVNTNTFNSENICLGSLADNTLYWDGGSLAKLLIYATAAPLTTPQKLYLERGVGKIAGISVP